MSKHIKPEPPLVTKHGWIGIIISGVIAATFGVGFFVVGGVLWIGYTLLVPIWRKLL